MKYFTKELMLILLAQNNQLKFQCFFMKIVKKFKIKKNGVYPHSEQKVILIDNNENNQKLKINENEKEKEKQKQKQKIIQSKPTNINKTVRFQKNGKIINQQQFQHKIKCIKSIKQDIPIQSGKIQVIDPKKQTTSGFFGLGAVTYLTFRIITPELKWDVRRRYNDFQWLRGIISKFFPTYIIPPLARKHSNKRTERQLQKKMKLLTFFLNDLAAIPEIFHSKYVEGFMNISTYAKFQQYKQLINQKESVTQILSEFESQTGQVTIRLKSQEKIYKDEIQGFINKAEILYKQINRNSKRLQSYIIEQTNTIYGMANQFAGLHQIITNFNKKLPSHLRKSALDDTYITLNNALVQWGNIIKNQYVYLQKNFNIFFKYIRNQLYSYRDLLQKVNVQQEQYLQKKNLLEKKKQRIFALNDPTKWEIAANQLKSIPNSVYKDKEEAMKLMLPRESSQLVKLKTKYCFYNTQFFQHSEDCFYRCVNRFCQNFKEFAIKIKINNHQLKQLWTQIVQNFADPTRKPLNADLIKPNQYIQDT